MAKEKNNKHGGGIHFLAGYGWQVLAVPLGAAVLLLIFSFLFGYDVELFWMNVLVLALWGLLVMFQRRPDGGFWRNYRWIVALAVLIFLFLLDASWAQSALSISSLKKRAIWPPASETFPVHAEYPLQILFDDAEPSEIGLWLADAAGCGELEISAERLRFAVKPPSDAPPVWSDTLTLKLSPTTKAVTVLAQPFPPPEMTSETVRVILAYNGTTLDKPFEIAVEGKREAKIRAWKKSLLDASSVSVIIGIAASVIELKRKEEEERKRKQQEIENALSDFEQSTKDNFSTGLEKLEFITREWSKWERESQSRLRWSFIALINEYRLWEMISLNLEKDIKRLLQISERIFDDIDDISEYPVYILERLQAALRQDADSPRALLSLLKEYPPSIEVARRIAASFSPELKKQTIDLHAAEFPDQIRALRVELGFGDPESFPLRRQFAFHARPAVADDRLNAWLNSRGLECSPFADDGSPFYSVLRDQLLVELASPGFLFPTFERHNVTFEFANDWDAAAALYAYCRSLQSAMTLKEEIFFVPLSPSLMMTHEGVDARKLYLHALAEQWLWSLAETPTLFYALKDEHLDLAGRLLRWHDLSPSLTAHKIAQFAGRLQAQEKKHQADLLSRITAWLKDKDATDLQAEEVNGLIELRPPSKQQTLFLLSASDLNPHVRPRISQNVYEELARQSDWLSAHNCGFIRFLVGDRNWQSVSQSSLIEQCRIRVQKCSNIKLEFNELFDAHGQEPDVLLAQKAGGSPGKMVRLGQKLLLQHAAKPSPEEYLQIEDLLAL